MRIGYKGTRAGFSDELDASVRKRKVDNDTGNDGESFGKLQPLAEDFMNLKNSHV